MIILIPSRSNPLRVGLGVQYCT